MSTTVLSEDIVILVGKLADLQSRKDELLERIQLYENKLNMSRDASLALINEEQELANQLHELGFYYGQAPVQEVPAVPAVPEIPAVPAVDQHGTKDQLATLLNSLFKEQTSNQQAPNTTVPTSGSNSFGGGIYNFPQPSPLPPNGLGPVPTSGTTPIQAVPQTSPTSAPRLSIRRGGGN